MLDSDIPKKDNKTKKMIVIVSSLSMLIIFPILALYMSSSGLGAYKALRAEMKAYKDSVQVPNVDLISATSGANMTIAALKDKVVIAHFYDKNCSDCDVIWGELKRIQGEFAKKTKRVHIVSYSLQADSTTTLNALVQKQGIDTSNWNMLTANAEVMSTFTKAFKIDSSKYQYTLALIDRKGVIVNYYDARKKEEINNMMKHTTILLPAKEDRRKIKFAREKEVYK